MVSTATGLRRNEALECGADPDVRCGDAEVLWAAADLLCSAGDVAATTWSVTSWASWNRDGVAVEKERRCATRDRQAPTPYVTQVLSKNAGPVVAVSDWMVTGARADPGLGTQHLLPTPATDVIGFSIPGPAAVGITTPTPSRWWWRC